MLNHQTDQTIDTIHMFLQASLHSQLHKCSRHDCNWGTP